MAAPEGAAVLWLGCGRHRGLLPLRWGHFLAPTIGPASQRALGRSTRVPQSSLWNLTARSEVILRKVAETLHMERPSRILVVDDEENIRELLAMGLRYE